MCVIVVCLFGKEGGGEGYLLSSMTLLVSYI